MGMFYELYMWSWSYIYMDSLMYKFNFYLLITSVSFFDVRMVKYNVAWLPDLTWRCQCDVNSVFRARDEKEVG